MGRSPASTASTAAGRRRGSASGSRSAPTRRDGAKGAPRKRVATRKPAKGARRKQAKATARTKATTRKPAKASVRAKATTRKQAKASLGLGRITWRVRFAILVVLLAVAAGGYFFWFRDSSLVAINDVEVVGATSGEREAIVAELTRAGEEMSTLHVDRDRLETVATSFATISAVDIDPNFPHGLRLELTERPPAILLESGGEEVPVAADGTVLAGVPIPKENDLPLLDLGGSIAGGALEGDMLERALVAGAAPGPLRSLIEKVEESKDFGLVVTLKGGIPVRFGTSDGVTAKWRAAAAVLADPKLDYASYVDVRVPGRPAAGDAARPVDELEGV